MFFQLAINCEIFGYEEKELKVFISKLNFKGDIFSFILRTEEIDETAHKILKERISISNIFFVLTYLQ